MNHDHALDNLLRCTRALRASGLTPFLVDGTLLGCVRGGGFIAHDKDVDLGVFVDRLKPQTVRRAMRREGMQLGREFGALGKGYEMAFRRQGVKVDVFAYYTDTTGHFHAAWQGATPIRYRYWPFELKPVQFLGHTFMAPDDPERFLATKYGPDWRIPRTTWDWAWGPNNAEVW